MLALDVAALLAPVTSALFEEVKTLQFCASLVVRGAFTADDSYTLQVHTGHYCCWLHVHLSWLSTWVF